MIREKIGPIVTLMLAALIIGASIGLSARANAAPIDDLYVETLDHFAVPYRDEHAAIELGHAICDSLDQGLTIAAVLDTAGSAGWNYVDAGHVTGAAIGAYCPEYGYLVRPGKLVAA